MLWMATDSFPWDWLQTTSGAASALISSLQFPYRWIGWATVFLVTAAGYLISFFKHHQEVFYRMGLVAAVVGIATSYVYLIDSSDEAVDVMHLYNEESMGFGYISGEEYLVYGTDSGTLSFARPEAGDAIQLSNYEKKGLQVDFYCENSSDEPQTVKLPIFLYKGYSVLEPPGNVAEITDGENHLLLVGVPAGYSGRITVKFTEPWYWRVSELITLGSVIAFAIWLVHKRRYE